MAPAAPATGAEPVVLIESEDTGDRFLVYQGRDGVRAELRVDGDTFWASQAQMAAMFGVDQSVISRHVSNIVDEGELPAEGNMQKVHISKARPTTFHNLNMLISVGYRVGGPMGTMFRIWATDKLFQYLSKGFVIDDERLKNPDGRPDHFEELLERVRDIRSSEKRMWTRVLELAAFCADYDATDQSQHVSFFAEIQNTMHWAVLQMTAPELVRDRIDAQKDHAGVVLFKGKAPTVEEARTAKNLLMEPEISALNHITSLTLEFFESQAEQRRLTTLAEFLAKLRDLVKLDGRPLKQPGYAGQVSRADADQWASVQVRDYKHRKRLEAEQAGEAALKRIAADVRAAKQPRKRKPT